MWLSKKSCHHTNQTLKWDLLILMVCASIPDLNSMGSLKLESKFQFIIGIITNWYTTLNVDNIIEFELKTKT